MNTSLTLPQHTLTLYRYPKDAQDKSLQAWDAADEYLLSECQDLDDNARLAIFNDDFGALACALNQHPIQWFSDSHIAHLALKQNLAINQLLPSALLINDSLSTYDGEPDVVLIKIPRSHALLEHQLISLQGSVGPDTRIIASGKANKITSSVLALFEKHLGPTTTSLARKKARLIYCQPNPSLSSQSPYPTKWQAEGFSLVNHANVFARQQLDIGARLLMANLPVLNEGKVIDLGCGNGVLTLAMLRQSPALQLTLVDESYMAVASAKTNIKANFPDLLGQCDFTVNDCLDGFSRDSVDAVLCNPPFHQQNALTDHIAWQMFSQARDVLKVKAELRVVANRHLGHHLKLKRLFGGCKVLASNSKFVILSAIKR